MALTHRRTGMQELADKQHPFHSKLLLTVCRIVGIKDSEALCLQRSLEDYGFDSFMSLELAAELESHFRISLSTEDLSGLCVNDIINMVRTLNRRLSSISIERGRPVPEAVGVLESLEALILLSNVKNHHDLSELIPLKTLIELTDGSKCQNTEILFMIHPMEGGVLPVLASVTSHLRVRTYGLNCTNEADVSSLEALAAFYIKVIRKVVPEGRYNLTGYSFGAGVAFEIALQLQAQNKEVRRLILLDGSPELIVEFTKAVKVNYGNDRGNKEDGVTEESLEMALISMFVGQFVKTDRTELHDKLQQVQDFEGRVAVARAELRRCDELSEIADETLDKAITLFVHRQVAAARYKPGTTYTGPITLIKSSKKMIRHLDDTYGLKKVCASKVKVCTVDGTHESFVHGDAGRITAKHINEEFRHCKF